MSLVPLSGPAVTLMEALEAERVEQADAQRAVDTFVRACSTLSKEDHQAQFDGLLSIVDELPTGPACFLAVVCGALLEQGAWPGRMGEVVHRRLEEVLPQASYLARECRKREQAAIPEPTTFANADEEDAYYQRVEQVGAQAFEELSRSQPLARDAWNQLGALWPACVAVYSRDVAARVRARAFLPVLEPLANRHEGAHWLQKLLPVLDQEPLLVIDPEKQVGITARMSGVSDNFQLHTLLMDVFPRGWIEGRRVSQQAVDVATGVGPQQTAETITGRWNLYQPPALSATGKLPSVKDDSSAHWVWGEGIPADIAIVQGHRVVLLGPPSYARTWPSVRLFSGLRASLDEVIVLDKAGVREWIRRLTNQ